MGEFWGFWDEVLGGPGRAKTKGRGRWSDIIFFIGLIVEPLRSEKVTCGEASGRGRKKKK